MKKLLIALAAALLPFTYAGAQPAITQADSARAAEIVSRMTTQEKIDLISGKVDGFHTQAVARLGVPSVRMADGPQGVRNGTRSTYYPSGIALSATWNRDLASETGRGIGEDAKARGVGIMLCPGVNIYRSALDGRNFEYYGEDPYLASETAAAYVEGMQATGTMATIKHFALNNQEFDRHGTGSVADERTMNEIYFPTFRKAVERSGVGAVMTSYNAVNGTHAAENRYLIDETLRGAWGFKGIIMSDWTSTYSPINTLINGVDFEMPKARVFEPALVHELLRNGVVSECDLDRKCQNILQTYSAFGLLGDALPENNSPADNPETHAIAYRSALEAPVLLKNEGGILPLKGSRKPVVLIGPNADKIAFGGGSGYVHAIAGATTTLKQGLEGLGKAYNISYLQEPDADKLRAAAAVIVAVGFDSDTEKEGADRTYELPDGQEELIRKVLSYNKKVVVVANSGGEFALGSWIDQVPAVLLAWYGGEAQGKAVAEILAGMVSPSGRLPFTWWGTLEKNPAMNNYRFVNYSTRKNAAPNVDYAEGVFLGYRGVEHFGVQPLYPFGYGLTYSSFKYSALSVEQAGDGYEVVFTVTNTGKALASEVAQVYVAPKEPSVMRPARELKGYAKVQLAPGKSQQVRINLGSEAFEYYSTPCHRWVADKGAFEIEVGASAGQILLRQAVQR